MKKKVSKCQETLKKLDATCKRLFRKSELVETIWELARDGKNEKWIVTNLYVPLLHFVGRAQDLPEVLALNGQDREQYLRLKFHGVVGNYILAALHLGDYVKMQFMQTMKHHDGLIGADSVELNCERDVINELHRANHKDKDANVDIYFKERLAYWIKK